MNPMNFELDDKAVNVYAANNSCWEGVHIGHMATEFTAPIPHLLWGHYFQALMVNEVVGLPNNLSEYMTFGGECMEETTHRPSGSSIYVYIGFDIQKVTEEVISSVASYLRSASMEIIML